MERVKDIINVYYGTFRHYFSGPKSGGLKNTLYKILSGWWPFEGNSFLICLFIIFLFSACISVISIIIGKKNGRKGARIISAMSLVINAGAILSMLLSVLLVVIFWRQIAINFAYTRGLVGTFYTMSFWVTLICFIPSILFIFINIILCIIGSGHKNIAPAKANVFVFTCPRCGKPVLQNNTFCSNCGEKINRQ